MTNLLFKLRTVVSCLSKNSTVPLFFDIEIPKFDKKNIQFCLRYDKFLSNDYPRYNCINVRIISINFKETD